MTDQLELLGKLETYVGAAFVAFYGYERFRKPPSEPGARQAAYPSRATTTAASYYSAVFLYCGIGVLLYGTLLFSPSVLEKIWALVPQLGDEVPSTLQHSPSVVVALLLTVLLSKVPALAALDNFVRTRLQHMAAIPHEVRRMAVELKRAAFRSASDAEYAEIAPALLAQGFDEADVRIAGGDTLLGRWLRLDHADAADRGVGGGRRPERILHRMSRRSWTACASATRRSAPRCAGPMVSRTRAGGRGGGLRGGAERRRGAGRSRRAGAGDDGGLSRGCGGGAGRAGPRSPRRDQPRSAPQRDHGAPPGAPARRAGLRAGDAAGGAHLAQQPHDAVHRRQRALHVRVHGAAQPATGRVAGGPRAPLGDDRGHLLRSTLWCALGPKTYWAGARRAAGSTRPWCAYLLSALAAAFAASR